MITGSIFTSTNITPNKSPINSNNNISNYKKPLTNPISRGEISNMESTTNSRGMSFMVGNDENLSEMDKYDNYMQKVI